MDVVREVATAYRRHARWLLIASAIVELPLATLSAPYLVNSFRAFGDLWKTVLQGPGLTSLVLPPSYAVFANPVFTALGGVLVVAPLVSFVLLSALVTGLLLRPAASPDSGAVRFVARQSRPLAALALTILGLGLLLGAWSGAALGAWWAHALTPPDPASLGGLFAAQLLLFGAFIISAYAFIRGALTVSALVLEGGGLLRAARLSTTLTRRRAMRVALAVAIGLAISGAANALTSLLAGTAILLAPGPGQTAALLLLAALYALTRIVVAPVLPLLMAVLYRDFRAGGTWPWSTKSRPK